MQLSLQPDSEGIFPSSQVSTSITFPSPHIGMQESILVESPPEQIQPSIKSVQSSKQPIV